MFDRLRKGRAFLAISFDTWTPEPMLCLCSGGRQSDSEYRVRIHRGDSTRTLETRPSRKKQFDEISELDQLNLIQPPGPTVLRRGIRHGGNGLDLDHRVR